MQIESQVSLDCEAHLHLDNNFIGNGDSGVALPAPNDVTLAQQQPAKKPTRQWAAWTRQEEESFFTALRQVGKNFEKITSRVQSKNKDQVRHYYYRLVRRMNKMLGPGLCLDAKNSKDTNAAMLRWWSLLEKYSCKASKLRLKPRRLKVFLETLENQLLKDRNKNVKKRPSNGENCSPTACSTVSNQTKASGDDTSTTKLILVDSQNIQKLGSGKGSLKRNLNVGSNRSNCKGESMSMKAVRQRRKPAGTATLASYRKWEKAAIYGVSLVADAAEHLERTSTDKELEQDQGQVDFDPAGKGMPSTSTFSQNLYVESNIQASVKLKLQLFPIDDATRRALEMDEHNPHLELTLSTRKKISSVLEHLSRKWGNSSAASGELMLFPYDVQKENTTNCLKWMQNTVVSAAEVYAAIGSPSVFRLRYGWFNSAEDGSIALQNLASYCIPGQLTSYCIPGQNNINTEYMNGQIMDSALLSVPSTNEQSEERVGSYNDQPVLVRQNHVLASCSTSVLNKNSCHVSPDSNNNLVDSSYPATNISWHMKDNRYTTIKNQRGDVDDLRVCNSGALSAGEWADSLTNVSVGDLLSDAPQDMEPNCINPSTVESSHCLQQISFSCDSFDAAIAAHISRHQGKMGFQSGLVSQASSIWDAEETCDAFSFQKNHVSHHEVPNISDTAYPGPSKVVSRMSSVESASIAEELLEVDGAAHSDPMDEPMNNSPKDFGGLADIYWPDSLGPLDLDVQSTKYHSEDFILSDSLSGLNRLVASSLDAFQNCSFFGLDKKEPSSTVEARKTASFSDFKIGGGV